MISDDKKEEIREAADLVEVVGDHVRLKRSGSSFVGLCPFHDEKTPSFNVNPQMGIYKCFGCGEGGDVFRFVMEMEGVGFQESLRTLAERYGVSLPDVQTGEEDHQQKEKEGIYHALKFAGLFYFMQLRESGEADVARKYLEKRGYDGKVIRSFGLGYAPGDGDALLKAARKEGLEDEYLYKADLIKPSNHNDGFYDTFRRRLIFPIFNPSGKVIAFAGRTLGNEKTAKYINSAQTTVYNKSEVVYGVNFSKNDIRKEKEIILVEGYTDVITLIQKGIRNVVASSGTALTPGQIRILKRYGKKIVMIYDADGAGQSAMKRGMNIALAEGMDVDLLELPDKEDPDSFLRNFGRDSFLELKKREAVDFVSFTIGQAERNGEMESPAGRTKVISRVLESIAEIPEPLARQVYVQHLHQKTQRYRNSSDKELFDQLARVLSAKEKRSTFRPPDAAPRIPKSSSGDPSDLGWASAPHPADHTEKPLPRAKTRGEMELIRLMLEFNKEMIQFIGNICNEALFEDEQLKMFYLDIINRHRQDLEISVKHYRNRETPYPELVSDIMVERHTPSERHSEKTGVDFKKDKDPYKTAKSTIRLLRITCLKRYLASLTLTDDAGPEEKETFLKKKVRTQKEITRLESSTADELFPTPKRDGNVSGTGNRTFEYKMKNEQND